MLTVFKSSRLLPKVVYFPIDPMIRLLTLMLCLNVSLCCKWAHIYSMEFLCLQELLIASRNLEFFTSGYRYVIQVLPAAVVAPMYFSGKIEFGVINQSYSAFNHILSDFSIIIYQFQALSAFSAVIDRLGRFIFFFKFSYEFQGLTMVC